MNVERVEFQLRVVGVQVSTKARRPRPRSLASIPSECNTLCRPLYTGQQQQRRQQKHVRLNVRESGIENEIEDPGLGLA